MTFVHTMVMLRKIKIQISLALMLMLLASTSGFTMDLHYCQGHLKRVNFFGKAKTCQELALKAPSCYQKKQSCHQSAASCSADANHDGCCENERVQILMDENVISYDITFDNLKKELFAFSVWNHTPTVKENTNQLRAYLFYQPPIPDVPVFIRYCSFLR